MKLMAGLIGSFLAIVYLTFMASDVSHKLYKDVPSQAQNNDSRPTPTQAQESKAERAPASLSDASSTTQQEGLLRMQQNSAKEVTRRESDDTRNYAVENPSEWDQPNSRNPNAYERMASSSNRSIPSRRSSGIGTDTMEARAEPRLGQVEGSSETSSGSGFNELGDSVVVSKGQFDKNDEASAEDSEEDNSIADGQNDGSSFPTTSSSPTMLDCQASEQGGTFSSPLKLEVTCNASSTIRYCLSSTSTCCDPDGPDSQVYNSTEKILMGAENTDYCLSYYADSNALSQNTEIESNIYTFNSDFPELNVDYTKKWVQSTQINERSEFSSADFSKENHHIGQMNYLTHDISDPALDASCYDLALNNMGLEGPTPTETMAKMEVTALQNTDQVNLYYSPENLEYSENYLLSYIVNETYEAPLYSCQVSTVKLEDFHITNSSPHHLSTESGVGQIQGQFTSYGFFETSLPARSPAGESNDEVGGIELRTNFLSVLYQ